MALRENYDISTLGLTDQCSASELPKHIQVEHFWLRSAFPRLNLTNYYKGAGLCIQKSSSQFSGIHRRCPRRVSTIVMLGSARYLVVIPAGIEPTFLR